MSGQLASGATEQNADFLLELRCEEIPARMQAGARADLERLFRDQMTAAGVEHGDLIVWSTPRRLALIAQNMPGRTEAVSEEAKGPPEGAPDQAVDGFCKKNGVTRDQLEVRDVKGRATYFAVKNVPGRDVKDVLAEAIPAIVRTFPWPKSMRWGAPSISTESTRWVRPLSGIVAMLGDDLVECSVGDVTSGTTTLGHRFHHDGPVSVDPAGYDDQLLAAKVIVSHEEREAMIRSTAAKIAADAGLELVRDEGLVIENAGLTEWPVPLLGRFDEAFLDVPPEVIQLTARVNQKYFVCEDGRGKLANAFVCTANIAADDPSVVVEGNRKVLAARLSDARFFWELDQKTPLRDHAKKLERITFHERLGTVAEKVRRVAKLSDWLVFDAKAPNGDHKLARQAAELCKADLVTEMVGEFPELQGVMGGYYARAEGLPDEVADAIRDHYKPAGQNDEVPTAPTTVAVALADRLDNLLSFFKIGILPTGSKDPFALRRAALGYLRLVQANGLELELDTVVHAWDGHRNPALADKVTEFLLDRLAVQLKDEGVRHDYIAASREWRGRVDYRVDRVESRARSLAQFLATDDGTNLLAGYKRAANILKKEGFEGTDRIARTGEEDPLAMVDDPDVGSIVAERGKVASYDREPAEQTLVDALDRAEPSALSAVGNEDFAAAMTALASLRAPIDAFFDDVTVNDADPKKRTTRLALLARFVAAVHKVADFSRIEG
ncbi:glycine--tRNA ligase subunit beta [Croceicoccus naphthovorans]|uniref:Glycine--tRNA ligase beta subunit n=1 Tax=Croceicoccus naphthovorans TaxID=1348774 RepID=A0A0G3XIB1_9SPHN|nr:glycine--tRNA ligase subunit beta [Croceicoccus naphthovorans]AKM10068.1 glycyl-tRNA synthetase subunit beta [Croceicoccus naphthovorans]MBB3991215.1 glycyl-tRNA synthetase beta chain [Croceicoccus naphthovorans]